MARLTFRQGIVRHQTDTLNNPTFLLPVGDYVNLNVSPDFTIIAFVHGTTDYLYTESVSIVNAWGPFVAPNDYWLYWDLNLVTGIVTRGSTTLEPIESPAPPSSPGTGQMWFNTATNTMYAYNGSSFAEVVRVLAAKYTNATTLQSVSINTPLFTGTQVGLTSSTRTGSLVFDAVGKPIKTGSGNKFFTTEDSFVTGVPTGAGLRVENITISGQTNAPIAAYQVVQFNDFAQIGIADPFQQGLRVFGIVEEDAVTNEVVNFLVQGMIHNSSWDWDAAGASANDPVYADMAGMISLTPVIPNQLPVGVVIGLQEILFAPGLFPQVEAQVAAGVTDHSLLDAPSLLVDDHPQYHNDVRGDLRYLQLTGGNLSGNLTMSAGTDVILQDAPTAGTDAANKAYVDQVAAGIKSRPAVRVRTNGTLPTATYDNGLAGFGATLTADAVGVLPDIDSVTLSVGDRLLVADQTAPAENGVYHVLDVGSGGTPWILERCPDCDEAHEIPSSYVFAQEGLAYENTGWVATVSANPFVVGTDDVIWVLFQTGAIPTQNLWETIVSDSGSAVANIPTDSLSIVGGDGIDTAIVGDVLTISAEVECVTIAIAFGGFGSEGAALSTVYTSIGDVTSWTGARPSHGDAFVGPKGAAYAPAIDTWVYTSGSTPAYYSTDDGVTWTAAARVNFFTNAANASTGTNLAWSEPLGLFIMGGNTGQIQKSSDGIVWSDSTDAPQTSGTFGTAQILTVAWSDDLALFVCGTSNNEVGYSADGDTWTLTTEEPGGAGSADITGIHVVGSRIFVGRDTGTIHYSDDTGATAWILSTQDFATGGFQPDLGFASNNDGSIIIMGGIGLNNARYVWRSVDNGVSFTRVDVLASIATTAMYAFCIIWDTDYGFIMGGRDSALDEHIIVTSDDGLTWTLQVSEKYVGPPAERNDFDAIASKKQNGQVPLVCTPPGGGGGGGGLENVVEDLTPQLGGDLDVNGFAIITPDNVAGAISLIGGATTDDSQDATNIVITAGGSDYNSYAGGKVNITGGASPAGEGDVNITGGAAADGAASVVANVTDAGNVNITGGQHDIIDGSGPNNAGWVNIAGGSLPNTVDDDSTGEMNGGGVSITGGFVADANDATGGPINISGGDSYAYYGASFGGRVTIKAGEAYDFAGDIVLEGGGSETDGGSVIIQASVYGGALGGYGGDETTTRLRFQGLQSNTTLSPAGRILDNYIAFRAPDLIATEFTLTLPATDSTGTQALVSDGAGTLSWASLGGGLPAAVTECNILVANDANTYVERAIPELPRPYDIAMQVFGAVPDDETVFKFVTPQSFVMLDYGHQGHCTLTGDIVDSIFGIYQGGPNDLTTSFRLFINGVQKGQMGFHDSNYSNPPTPNPAGAKFYSDVGDGWENGNGSYAGTFINIAVGDVIEIKSPVTASPNFEDVAITLRGIIEPAVPCGTLAFGIGYSVAGDEEFPVFELPRWNMQLRQGATSALYGFTSAGINYAVSDTITMNDGSLITVTAGVGAITDYVVTTSGGPVSIDQTVTQVSTSGSGTGFEIDNIQDNADLDLIPQSVTHAEFAVVGQADTFPPAAPGDFIPIDNSYSTDLDFDQGGGYQDMGPGKYYETPYDDFIIGLDDGGSGNKWLIRKTVFGPGGIKTATAWTEYGGA